MSRAGVEQVSAARIARPISLSINWSVWSLDLLLRLLRRVGDPRANRRGAAVRMGCGVIPMERLPFWRVLSAALFAR